MKPAAGKSFAVNSTYVAGFLLELFLSSEYLCVHWTKHQNDPLASMFEGRLGLEWTTILVILHRR